MARLLKSTPMRLSLALVALFTLVSLISLTASYFVSRNVIESTIRAGLLQELAGFRAAPNSIALRELVRAQGSAMNPSDKIISYTDTFGRRVGNGIIVRTEEGFEAVALSGEPGDVARTYFALTERLHGGYLTLAASADARAALRQTFLIVLGVSLLPTAAIALTGGLLIARRSDRRLLGIESTLAQLTSGDLAARVPAMRGGADDLSRIARRIDKMATAQEANTNALRQVSADIAHDLKTPIQRVAVLLEEAERNPSNANAIARAKSETTDIVKIFQALLQIAQIEGGSPRAHFDRVELGEVAETMVEVYAPDAEEGGQTISLKLDAPEPVFGERTLIGQMLANLIENALRHAGPNSQIAVSVEGTRLSVSDTGPGIPAQEHENVLRRLYRLDQSRNTPGNGLGLSLVKVIADLHDCKLDLRDNDPGLVVSLTFPTHHDGASN